MPWGPCPQYLQGCWCVCFPLCVLPGLLCGLLTPSAAQEVSVAGGMKNILLGGIFFFLMQTFSFFFGVEVGHSRGDRVRASLPGYCIPLPW